MCINCTVVSQARPHKSVNTQLVPHGGRSSVNPDRVPPSSGSPPAPTQAYDCCIDCAVRDDPRRSPRRPLGKPLLQGAECGGGSSASCIECDSSKLCTCIMLSIIGRCRHPTVPPLPARRPLPHRAFGRRRRCLVTSLRAGGCTVPGTVQLRSGAYPPFGHQRPCMIAGKGGVFEKKGSGNARRRRCLSLDGSENTPGKGGVSAKTKAVEASKGGVSAHIGSGSARQRPCLSTQRQWRMQGTGGAPKTVEIARHNCTAQKRQLTHTLRVWRCLGRQRQRRVHGSGECTAHRVHGVGRSSPGPPHAQGFGLPSESLPQVLAWYSRYPNTLHGAAPPILKASREYLS